MKKNIKTAIIGIIAGMVSGELLVSRRLRKSIMKNDEDIRKFYEFYMILLRWLRVRQEGRSLVNYFKKNQYHTVAVYGMRELGEALLEELSNSEIKVLYGLDKNADNIYSSVDVYSPDEELPEVDVIVVTAVHYYDDIEQYLQHKTNAVIVSVEDVVWEA